MSFFRTAINPEVQKELFRRIDGINKAEPYTLNGKSVSNILDTKSETLENEYFKTCWARVITIDGTGNPYYLNSQLGSRGNKPITEPLNIKDGNYSRGRAGITSISSNFKEFFLKQSTISFLCPDPKEFEEIQNQFLKHGRYVLVEFGWSTRKNIMLEEVNTDNLVKFSKNLNEREQGSRGNYTAICGVITNFNFNQKQDGSYEGTFEVSSMGRNILGQKIKTDGKIENLVNYINETIEKDSENDNPETPEVETNLTKAELENFKKIRENFVNFFGVMKALPNVIQEYVDNRINTGLREETISKAEDISSTTKPISIISKSGMAAYIPSTSRFNFKRPEDSQENLAYCSWGWFEDHILNTFFSFSSKSGSESQDKFKTQFFSTDKILDTKTKKVIGNTSTTCKSNPNLFSLGLQSIILPGKFKQFKPDPEAPSYDPSGESAIFNELSAPRGAKREIMISEIIKHFNEHFPNFERQDRKGQIRNMVFEANYLMESFIGATNIDEAMVKFWQKVSNDYGNFWRFSITQDPDTDGQIKVMEVNQGMVEDKNVPNLISNRDDYINWELGKPDPERIFKFPLYSQNSVIQDFSIQTAYDSEMATMAVFGSNADMQATRGDMGQGYTELAIRALSILQNPKSIGNATTLQEEQKQKYDNILTNISTPYLRNTNSSRRGASSKFVQTNDERYNQFFTDVVNTETMEKSRRLSNQPFGSGRDKEISAASNTYQQLDDFGIDFVKVPEIAKHIGQIEEDIEESNSFDTSRGGLRKGYFWFELSDEQTQIYSSYSGQILQEIKRTMLYKINKSSDDGDESNYRVVLPVVPLQLSLTIQGIGGIKIGDLFYIDYLPQRYRKYCHWMVVGVDHEISTTGWTTKLDSRMIVNIPKLIEENPKVFTKLDFKPFVIRAGQQLKDKVAEIQKQFSEKDEEEFGKSVGDLWIATTNDKNKDNPYVNINQYILAISLDPEITGAADILEVLKAASIYNSLNDNEKILVDNLESQDIQRVLNGTLLGVTTEEAEAVSTRVSPG